MNKLTLLSRHSAINKNPNLCGILYLIRNLAVKKAPSTSSSSSNSSSSDSDVDRKRKANSNEAVKKLNLLLEDIINDKAVNTKPIETARPRRNTETKAEENAKVSVEPIGKDLVESVKDVAESLGGNVKQTESELLAKLLSTSSRTGDAELNLSEIVKGLKVDTGTKTSFQASRANQVRSILQQSIEDDAPRRKESRKYVFRSATSKVEKTEKIDLFGSKPLGYFQSGEQYDEGCQLSTWDRLNERELRLAVTHPPANYFQQMILWTEQGKIWKFPIDNEQGMEEEQNIYFTEHVLLEKHLDPWCPSKGPVRHYMELVCVGLSKNPYMSVQHKKDHIAWYKDYFADKQKLLKEIGAVPQDFVMDPPPKISET